MSDKVKLIIEIPKSDYKAICENKEDSIIAHDTCRRIANNGIPLDDVKAEMKDLIEQYKEYRYANTYISLCIKILDRIIGKAESEE